MERSEKTEINNANVAVIVGLTLLVAFVALMVLSGKGFASPSARNDDSDTQASNSDNINEEEEVMGAQDVEQLKVEVVKEGDGVVTKEGDMISVHYTGTLLDGSKFDSSKDRGTPFDFVLGEGSVIEGWDVGLVGLAVGSSVILTIPSEMGYGEYGRPPQIPGGSALVFEVDILEIK